MNFLRPLLRAAAPAFLAAALFSGASEANSTEMSNFALERDLENLSFRNLDVFGSTVIGRIHAITQSPDGFMWIGTRQGAFRYDGHRIKAFHHDPDKPESIGQNTIWTLHVDHRDRLWIGTQEGLSRYLPETESFKNYLSGARWPYPRHSNQVNAIRHNDTGQLLASTEEGLVFVYDEELDRFSTYADTRFGVIKSMTLDPQQRLWLGVDNGVVRYDPQSGESRRFGGRLDSVDGVSRNYVNSVCYIDDETIWAGTSNRGVVMLNSLTGQTEALAHHEQREEFVNQISSDTRGNIWVASNAGVVIHQRAGGKTIRHSYDPEAEFTLPISGINTIYCDNQGNIWAGSNFDGVSIASRGKNFLKLPLHRVDSEIQQTAPIAVVMKDRDRNLWIGYTRSGLAMYPADGGPVRRFHHDPADPSSISSQPVLRMFEDSRGRIWVGTYRGGLYRYLPETQSFKRFAHDPSDPHSIAGHDIRGFAEDELGNLWINTHGSGISYLDTTTGKFENYPFAWQDKPFRPLDDWGLALCYDSASNLWVGTPVGVSVFDTKKGEVRHYQSDPAKGDGLSDSYINCIFEDSKRRIWIGTNDGLNRYLPGADSFESFGKNSGLPHSSIASIIEDDQGFLWTGTFDGLARFDPETGQAKAFSARDGLASNEFFESSAIKDEAGYLYFGQNKGVTKFLPSEIKDNTLIPEVHITGFRVFDRPLPIDPQSKKPGELNRSILNTREVELKHGQSSLTFEFVALNYILPVENQYSYKLEGFDADWSVPGSRRDVTYTNLNPGNYTFRVRASNNDGYWNQAGDSLAIAIYPPFWGTIWFRSAALLLIVAIPSAFFRWRVNSIKQQKLKLEEAVNERTRDLKIAHTQLEEAYAQIVVHQESLEDTVQQRTEELEIAMRKAERSDKLKSAFLANMSHEIRTPMNAIMGFLHLLNDESLRPEEREQFNNVIQRSSASLLSLIDDILDLSTIEAGEADIRLEPCNIAEVCEELRSIFSENLEKEAGRAVTLVFNADLPEPLASQADVFVKLDPLRLRQILWNLLSNAVKFTDEGEIRFGYRIFGEERNPLEKRLQFIVQDTGIGIPSDQCEQIFNRFHKLEKRGKRLYRGTGLGLTITKTLTELMGGSISVASAEGEGATFTVEFPYQPAPFTPGLPIARAAPEFPPAAPDYSGTTILVVEDEAPNFEYIHNVLRPTNATIEWANNGKEALQIYRSVKVDLILLDLKLPEIDGYEVAQAIREEDPEIPIIAQSAFAMRGDRDASLAAGATDHLAKPYGPAELLEAISRHMPAIS